MLLENLKNYKIILASQSPRRQYLLKELGIDFEIKIKDNYNSNYKESYPQSLKKEQIVEALYNPDKTVDFGLALAEPLILKDITELIAKSY